VVAGDHCSLAVTEDGRVYIWGEDVFGRLAPDRDNRHVPTLIEELSHYRVRQVAIQTEFCAAVTEEGLLFTWATAARQEYYDVESDAEQHGPQLGLGLTGITTGDFWPPLCVTALAHERVGSVAVGIDFALVGTEAGAVFSFGRGGSLGHGDRESRILPKRIEALEGVYVATVAAHGCQSLALTACGRVFWWGKRPTSTHALEQQLLPQLMDPSAFGGRPVWRISVNFQQAYSVTDAGVLFCWGRGYDGHDGGSATPLSNDQLEQSHGRLRDSKAFLWSACRQGAGTHWCWSLTAASMRSASAGPWASAGGVAGRKPSRNAGRSSR
jgi:hypothetical protein